MLMLGIAGALLSCTKKPENINAEVIRTPDAAKEMVSSSAAAENGRDSTRKFARTAELKFKVKNVVKSTYDIEAIAIHNGGFVTYTNLKSDINHVEKVAVSTDSSLESTYYSVSNNIVIRVPNTKLDTVLKLVTKNIDYLDYRIIQAEDVSLQILANELTQKRANKNGERVTSAINNKGQKLIETTAAEETVLSREEQSDNAKVSNLSIKDRISFSNIDLAVYQRETIKREVIAKENNIEEYEPGLGSRILEGLNAGWDHLEYLLVILANSWALLLFVITLYLVFRWSRTRFPKSKIQQVAEQ